MAHPTGLATSDAPSPAAGTDGRPLRKDAQRTRALVLDTARTLFAERGIDVSFDEIARAAGVGVGTVYRRFPDREALVDALFADKIEKLLAIVGQASEVTDPWESIVQFVERGTAQMCADRALAEVIMCASDVHEAFARRRDDVTAAVESVLRRAQEAGVLRPGVEVTDLAFLTHMVSLAGTRAGDETARRYVALVLDALRARPDVGPLPGRPLSMDDFQEIVQQS